ncbi:sensor histidine kinase [Dethiobacter alkaliphilus]|uniref:sensor histidine kinase n=1 Tax=Dethiobacter alkaliphilus TaxID=427926 RepID=UPI00222692BF|nr:sensor histidine kinase [Dethiobacter alkaliphilus]MCW3489057.1 sensor histidine kinase [Dethiobacter alkaliphilus]
MPKEYFFLYLIYGSAFINMGIFALQKKDVEVSNLALVRSLKYLGFFGITHGISEWVTMLVIADLYPQQYVTFFILKQLLKAFSFACLMYFGVSLLPVSDKYRKLVKFFPPVIFVFWLTFFMLLMQRHGWDYHLIDPRYNIIWLRYFMGFPGGLVSGIALYLNAGWMEERKLGHIAKKYKSLAYIFFVYSVLDGVIVREMAFFPASIINDTLFLSIFGFPIQIAKAAVGIGINILLIRLMQTFGWEQKEKLHQLQKKKIAYEERRKLGMEIHDGIIQGLYAAGLKAEYLNRNKPEGKQGEILQDIKRDLNNTIDKTREFLAASSLEVIEVEDLIDSLQQLADRFKMSSSLNIDLQCRVPLLTLGQLSPEKTTQIYYIVQEALSNVIKHAQATSAEVVLEAKYDYLLVQVVDNGIGIENDRANDTGHMGLEAMEHRAKRAEGTLKVENTKKGTMVELQVPWEVSADEKEH